MKTVLGHICKAGATRLLCRYGLASPLAVRWAANVPLKALTLRSKKAVTAKPNDEQRLKRSLLAKRPVADAILSNLDRDDEVLPVQSVGAENLTSRLMEIGGISC